MSASWNAEKQQYEVYSSLDGDMVPTGKPMAPNPQDDPGYCGYCKTSPCYCDGLGGGRTQVCGYCHESPCICDGFGNQPLPTEVCGYCHSTFDTQNNCNCDGFGNPL